MSKITIQEVAKLANVSKSTVSRYLNNGYVSDEVKKKLEKVIKQTGYQPNRQAQLLKSKATRQIGIIFPRLDSYASTQTIMGIDSYLKSQKYETIMINTFEQSTNELDAINTLINNNVEGIIFLPSTFTTQHIERLKDKTIPIVLVGQEHKHLTSIVYNDYEVSQRLAQLLRDKGHQKIWYIGVDESDFSVGVERKRGIIDVFGRDHVTVIKTTFDKEIAVGLMIEKLTATTELPSAIVCATDNIALGVKRALHLRGIKCPEQISVTGFGGYDYMKFTVPALTTIEIPFRKTGEFAAKTILELISQQIVPIKQVIDCEIYLGETLSYKQKEN